MSETMEEPGSGSVNELQDKLKQYEREIRRLNREIVHMKQVITNEKTAYTTILNQQKASTFIMRERERYLMLLLAKSPSIILFLSQTMRLEFCTEYFITKAGFESSADVMGRTLSELLAPFLDIDSLDKLLAQSRDVFESNVSVNFEVRFYFKKGGEFEDFDGVLVPMNNQQYKHNGVMLMCHDITDLKRSREEALAASKAKSSFLSNMSHEIRTPMNAIIGMTSIAKREKDPVRKDYAIEKIENASTHLLGIINDILDISKIESGKMELSFINFSFKQMLDRVKNVIAVKMQDNRQNLVIDIDPGIPDILYGDDQHLAQVITNLLSNATKFTPDFGSITFSAKLLYIEDNKCFLMMSVEDNGIGMSQEQQEKLFKAFQQAEAGTARKYGGTGLGLVISKHIIEMMDGEIWVDSELGKGSCFCFTATFGIPEQSAEIYTPGKTGEICGDFTGKTILIVDDVDINLEIVTALLEPANITADTAVSGQKAIDMFSENPERYDLILMDMQMPEIDGLEATRIIRSCGLPNAKSIPIIAMTANVFKEDIEKCMKAGMNDHLGKPIEIDEVMKKLSLYLK